MCLLEFHVSRQEYCFVTNMPNTQPLENYQYTGCFTIELPYIGR
jgi:hypothetical protein